MGAFYLFYSLSLSASERAFRCVHRCRNTISILIVDTNKMNEWTAFEQANGFPTALYGWLLLLPLLYCHSERDRNLNIHTHRHIIIWIIWLNGISTKAKSMYELYCETFWHRVCNNKTITLIPYCARALDKYWISGNISITKKWFEKKGVYNFFPSVKCYSSISRDWS